MLVSGGQSLDISILLVKMHPMLHEILSS